MANREMTMSSGNSKPRQPRSYLVDVLVILFGISSWVDINGLWVELPVLVQNLPEAWNLASYIVVTTQLANLGPLLFGVARRIWSQKLLEVPVIHATLAIGISSCVLLTIFWNEVSYVGGQLHSTALLLLAFCLAFVDCTSSVLYLPFMANFQDKYVVSLLVGEGMSGLLPSMVALAQGVGGNPECRNVTTVNVTEFGNVTEYHLEPFHPAPRFSVTIFFGILTGMVVVSWIAFLLLNILPQAKKEWVSLIPVISSPNPAVAESFMISSAQSKTSSTETCTSTDYLLKPKMNNKRYYVLLAIQAYICTLHNVLLSIQTYSCLPYGNVPYHLSVSLSSMANPIICFVAMFLAITSLKYVIWLTTFGSCWAMYIIVTAVLSPNPPFVDETLGAVLVVLSWVIVIGTMAFVKARIVSVLRREGGHSALYWCGVITQVGSASGAILTFGLVNYTQIFHSYTPCSSVN